MRILALVICLLLICSLWIACTEKTPGRLVLFDGFGTPSGARISGRFLENAPMKAGAEERSSVANLADNAAAFETDEIEGAVIEVEVLNQRAKGTTDADGVFTIDVPGPLAEGTVVASVRVLEDKGHPTAAVTGMIHVYGDREGVAVISDFDDTIVKTEVTSPVKMAANTLFRNAAQIPLVEGVSKAFADAKTAGASGFFYLSGSPHNLHERIAELLRLREMPRGPILLKNFGSDPLIEQEGYKARRLKEVMTALPRMRFVLIGDTGERDPEIYRALKTEFPDRVAGILIRRTVGSNMDPARFESCTLVDDYQGDPSPIAALIRGAAQPVVQLASDVIVEDDLSEKLRHCPTTVEGAKIAIRDVPAGVELMITAPDDKGATEIRARARHLADFTSADGNTKVPHGKGEGGGFMKNCPVVSKATRVTALDVERGSKIVVEPLDAKQLDALRIDVRTRHDELAKTMPGYGR